MCSRVRERERERERAVKRCSRCPHGIYGASSLATRHICSRIICPASSSPFHHARSHRNAASSQAPRHLSNYSIGLRIWVDREDRQMLIISEPTGGQVVIGALAASGHQALVNKVTNSKIGWQTFALKKSNQITIS